MNVPAVKLCECGCGQPAAIAAKTYRRLGIRKGEPHRYARGHHPRGSKNHRWNGGNWTSGSYVLVKQPGHPRANSNGYVREHILIVERAMGKSLRATAPVHHVDENGQNNANDNLVACDSDAYHGLLHRRMRAFLACGDPNARRCQLCAGYDNQSDVTVLDRDHAYHRACAAVRSRQDKATRKQRASDALQEIAAAKEAE